MKKTSAGGYTIKRVSPGLSPRFSCPAGQFFDSVEMEKPQGLPLKPGHTPSTSQSSRGQETFRFPRSPKRSSPKIGIITGETSTYFLVKQNSIWIPVAKTKFFSQKGERVTGLTLREVRNKKVKVYSCNSHAPEAHFFAENEVDVEAFTDRDFDTEPNIWDDESNSAVEMQMSLSNELLTDVVVLTSLSCDQQRSRRYIQHRMPRLRKCMDQAISSLRNCDSELYASVAPTCRQLLVNMDLHTTEAGTSCGLCTVMQSHVSLSCGHHLCLDCATTLLVFPSQTEFRLQHCPLCQRELSLTDSRLILLEKYEALKRGLKYTQAIGIDLSQISPH